jgi:hypothetical protein
MSKTTGLTLAEAVKSGRNFKHKSWSNCHFITASAYTSCATIQEALSSDWEIVPLPPKQTWTREEVEGIRDKILKDSSGWIVGHVQEVFEKAGL